MSRLKTRTSQFLIDISVLMLALFLATLVRFDWDVPRVVLVQLIIVLPYLVALQYAFLFGFGITRFSWRYTSLRDAVRIFMAIASATAVLVALRFLSPQLVDRFPVARYGIVPLGVLLGDFVLSFVGLTGVRALRRIFGERVESKRHRSQEAAPAPTLLVGAGQGGVLIAQEITRRPDLGILPVAFIDDDPVKQGAVIHGIKVQGTTQDLHHLAQRHGAKQALITISNTSGAAIRRITESCKEAGLAVKIVPGAYEIVGGRVNLSRIRDVAIEDLLRREQVKLDTDSVAGVVRGQAVMVTGAGGSIGSELCRQVAGYRPSRLILVERAENSLFEIHSELRRRFSDLEVLPCVADVTDVPRITTVFREHRPMVVFHAAAHKHVPMMEWNPAEAVKNNILGTQVVADLADRLGVERFVMISTDKAVNPTSVMGASKRAAELYVQALSVQSATHFATVRFGNVLGSAGSVIPIFRRQIRDGGPITVTHPDMTRYFMTIPEAVHLVIQAGALSQGGETFILDMGQPVRIMDLAHDLIRLSGLEPDKDIEIRFTGVRPGEKLFEELSTTSEGIERTTHPKIFTGTYDSPHLPGLRAQLETLAALCKPANPSAIRKALTQLVPEYRDDSVESEPPSRPDRSFRESKPMERA
ncbi:MAG: polysaccharide biosynthesis protein [Deltaproteobacteria bacterium]|nr:polysaccharide biosynthesis protein [Deltaproteobacteria bacterium]MBW2379977.1 polysaccharide biosynthesis protein [Deltaproteobacteria bacterium]